MPAPVLVRLPVPPMSLAAVTTSLRLNTSAALFQIEQDNLAQPDTGFLIPGTLNEASFAAQGTKSRGIDLEMTGELAPGWNAVAGVSHWTAKDGDSLPIQTDQPRTLVRAFTTYRLPGALDQFTVGGGVSWQSSFYGQSFNPSVDGSGVGSTVNLKQGGYTLVDLMTRYEFDDHLSFTVNANNVFDKKYLNGLGNFGTTYYGEPRNVSLTTKWDF